MLTIVLFLALAVSSTTMTLPLGCRVDYKGSTQQHLTHPLEEYPLKPLYAVFTLAMTIEEYSYELAIDTGSSDLFIKG